MNKGDVNYGAFYTTKEFQLHGTARVVCPFM